jgi:DNA-binding transcriptional ArsR family regulator
MGKQRRKARKLKGTVTASSPLDQRVARGMAHPLRAQILAYLTEHPVSSPAEMKKAGVGKNEQADLSHISYHTRVLEELALVEEVKSAPKRGAIEHFYRAISRMFLDVEAWKELPKEMKTAISVKAVEESLDRVSEAISMGTFDSRDERTVINLGLLLDEAGFNAASQKLDEVMTWLQEEQAAALQRAGGGESDLIYTSVSLLMYESPPKTRPAKDSR